jgi:aminopeptidase N
VTALLALLLTLALLQSITDPLMGPGVSRLLAEHRAATLGDVRYTLHLDVTASDSAVGTVVLRFQRRDTGDVVLDFRGRRLTAAQVNRVDLPAGAWNGAHVRIPRALLLAGENDLSLDFVADIAPSGASIIRFNDQNDGATYLYTLLVPADANQLFPCFDQPDLKSRVSLTLRTPAGWTAVANGSLVSQDSVAGNLVHRFTETRPISTYLIAFAAGPFLRASLTAEGRSINAYVRRSRLREADLDTLLALNARALAWMERYFNRPFPFEKYDFVLAPAFPFGGMEHPGAVFFNEDRFIFRERPTLPQRLGRFATILHEVAHMWFGDLVTMRWFDDLWLKEGFATYLAARALADLDSASGAWKTFYLGNKPAAYGVDQTAGTTPLWQELGNLDQAKSNYGAIVYNKAPSVLKQLNYLVGDDRFQLGVQAFLTEHAWGNATWRDLLQSIGRAARMGMREFGDNYILRPGMPEVTQHLAVREGRITRLALEQRPLRELSGAGAWPMRTQVLLFYQNQPPIVIPVEVSHSVTEVRAARGQPAPLFVYANAGDYGYMLVGLDSLSRAALLGGALQGVPDDLLRAMLWGTLWDEVRAARVAPLEYVRLALAHLPAERDEQIVPRVLGRVRRAMSAYAADAERETWRPRVERFLWATARDTAGGYGIRKAHLDAFVDLARTGEALARLDSLLGGTLLLPDPLGEPTRWDIVTHLLAAGAPTAEARLAAQAARDVTPDGRRRAFIAGAARPLAATKRDYFTRYFADSALNEDWASGSLAAFNTPHHQDLTLPWLRPALDSLRYIQTHRRIFFLGGWLGSFLGGQTSDAALATVRAFLAERPDLPADLRRKVLEHMDELERTVRIRQRWGAATGF